MFKENKPDYFYLLCRHLDMPNYAQAAIQIRQKKEREAKGKEIINHQDSGSVQEYKVKMKCKIVHTRQKK